MWFGEHIKKLSSHNLSHQAFYTQPNLDFTPASSQNMNSESKRAEMEDILTPPKARRPYSSDLDVNPANDLSDQQLWFGARVRPESGGLLILTPDKRVRNTEYPIKDEVFSPPDHADSEVSRVVIRNLTKVEHILNIFYPIQVGVLSSLDRTDFRSMQLAGLGLSISRIIQRLHLIPVSCSNSRALRPKDEHQATRLDFLVRIGWLPGTCCGNTTATMDEIKACTGMIWPTNSYAGPTDDIDACRGPHLDVTGNELNGSSHNVCLECIQLAERCMSLLEHHIISRLQRTLCSKHTREKTPQAQNEPCKCLQILNTEWRCWACRKSTLRGLTGIAISRKRAFDAGRYDDQIGDNNNHSYDGQDDSSDDDSDERSDSNDSEDRDMRDDRIPRDGAHFCPMSGCHDWISSQEQKEAKITGKGLKMCLACQTILLPPVDVGE